jgi:hypothetical protein
MPKRRFKFAGQTCVYCAQRPATTADHVFSRKFFLVERRENLPQVPACVLCNNKKSALELYLTAVLPFGGRHTDAVKNLADFVPRRLEENQALQRRLSAGLTREESEQGSVMTIPFEPEKLITLFEYIGRGLAWHHWGELIGRDTAHWAGLLNRAGEALFEYLFGLTAKARVTESVANSALTYEGVQSAANPQLTVWRFSLYGGAMFSGDPDAPQECVSIVAVVTGSTSVIDKFATMASGGPSSQRN